MIPVEFKGSNTVFGKDQPQYQPLPALVLEDGQVVTCWELTDEEIDEIVKNKRMYINQMTFMSPLQPILPSVYLEDSENIQI